jgi:hypothetical protein
MNSLSTFFLNDLKGLAPIEFVEDSVHLCLTAKSRENPERTADFDSVQSDKHNLAEDSGISAQRRLTAEMIRRGGGTVCLWCSDL